MSAGGKKKPGRKAHAGLRAQRTAIALEPRIMFDAAAAATIATIAEHTHNHSHDHGHDALLDAAAHGPGTTDWHHGDTASVKDVVFIDSAVPDIQTLIAGIKPGEQVFVLDPNKDGIQQIADILAANHLTGLSGIQIVGHGAQGEIELGSSVLNDVGLAAEAPALARIGAALAPGGDIALYSCDTAAGAQGAQFIADLSGYAGGVDVAASTHDIGSADLGGNWTLDAATGALPAHAPFTARALSQFQGDLAAATTPINNDQPSLALTQVIVTGGIFPNRNGSGADDPVGIPIGAIRTFAFGASNFVPNNTPLAAGQVLQIGSNVDLFSLLGTSYGGNGTNTFALPNLQGTTLIGTGQGSGLEPTLLGENLGTDSVDLNSSQMPSSIGGLNQSFDNHAPSLAVTYLINTGGHFEAGGLDMLGTIVPFAGEFAPAGYMVANGQLLSIAQNAALFNLIGTTYGGDGTTTFALPDLQGRTPVGASSTHPLGTEFGSENDTVTTQNLPFQTAGGAQDSPLNNDAPSLAVNYIIATTGVFPQSNAAADGTTPVIGEVVAYAGNAADLAGKGWALANGALLPINQNQALFLLLGTTYGGNGQTTFALPNLDGGSGQPGHDIVSTGTEPFTGASFALGQASGSDSITLTDANIIDALPAFQTVAGTVSSTEQVSAILEGSATVTDVNLAARGDYVGSSLIIQRDGGANADDGFGFDTTGALFTVNGSNLQVGGSTFASFTTANGILDVTFQGGSSQTLVNDVTQHVTYADQSHEPPASLVLDMTFSDGNTGGQGTGFEPGTALAQVHVNITATNPVLTSAATASVTEGTAAGANVYTATARDSLGGTLSYALGGTDANDFSLDPVSGIVTLAVVPDFESKPSYSFNVTANDSGGTSDTKTVTLNVADLAPVITSGSTATAINEGVAAGTAVYTAVAADPAGGMVSYSLTGTDASAFVIDAVTGIVTIKNSPDFETKSSYSFSVEASDPSGAFNIQAVTLGINDLPPVFASGFATASINEGVAAGTAVYTAVAADPVGGTVSYALGGTDASAFSINAATGVVSINAVPDFESRSSYSFTVKASDPSGMFTSQTVTLGINDVAPVITSPGTASINEGVAAGTAVYTTVAADPGGGTVSYALSGTDASAFTINAATGVVSINAVPDFESRSSYAFTVKASDASGLFTTQDVALGVNDLAPVISSGATASVFEHAAAGTSVYTAIAADPGGGTVSYALTGTDASAFSINTATGLVSINASPNLEVKSSYAFSVTASDASGDFSTQAVTLGVVNVNDAPSGANKTITTLEDTPYTFTAADFGFSDTGDNPANNLLAVKIDTLPTGGTLTDNGAPVTAGQLVSAFDIGVNRLVFTPAANANGNGAASFTFQVQDDGGTANGGVDLAIASNTISFNVTPVNDPPSGADKTISLAEDGSYTFAASDFGFSDPSDSPANTLLAVKIASLPQGGVLKDNGVAVTAGQSVAVADITGGKLVFTPTADTNGSPYTTFTFRVQDNGGTVNGGIDTDPTPNTITFDVTPVNHAPVATADSYSVNTGSTLSVPAAAGVLANDTDIDGDALSAVLGSTTSHGALTLNANGSFTYTPTAGYTGPDSFTYQAKDPSGALSGATTVSLTVGAAANSTGQLFYEINNGVDAGIYSVNPDGSGRTELVLPGNSFSSIAVDTAAHLLFVTGGANYVRVYSTSTGSLLATETYGTLATDETSSLAIDPATHTLFVGDFGPAAATIGIRELSYNASTGALTPVSTNNGFLFTAAQTETSPGNAATSRVTNPVDMVVDTANHLLYYADNDSDLGGFTATNQVYVVDYTAANPSPVQLTSSTQFPADNSKGSIDSIAVDSAKGLVYFLTDGGLNSPENALWYVSTSGGANQTAQTVSLGTGVTLTDPGSGFGPVNGLTLDTATQQLYITNDVDGTGNILVAQLSTDGHSASLVRTLGESTLSADTDPDDAPGPTFFNDVPVLTLDNNATFTEGTAQTLSPNLAISDPGGGALNGATVTISSGFLTGDVLAATTSGTTITASYNSTTHTLTLSGDDTLADYQTVLRSVTFNNTSGAPTSGTTIGSRTIAWTVSDGTSVPAGSVNSGSSILTVDAVNDAPVNHVPGAQSVNEDTALVFSGGTAITISDVDGGSGTESVTLSVAHGTLTLGSTSNLTSWNGNGTSSVTAVGTIANINAALSGLAYQGVLNFNGGDTITVTSNDNGNTGSGGAQHATSTIAVTVNPVNDAPVATADSYTATENASLAVSAARGVLANDSDVDGDAITAILNSDVSHGALTLNADGSFSYTPANGYTGLDSFTYKANDGQLNSNIVTVTLTVQSHVVAAANDSYTTNEDTQLSVAAGQGLLANDTGASLSVTAVNGSAVAVGSQITLASGAHLTVNADGSFSYSPAANANGPDSFSYTVSDGSSTAMATVAISVTSVNDAPLAADNSVTTLEDTPYIFAAADFGFTDSNDSPANSLLAVKIDTLPGAGILTDNGVAVTAGQFVPVADIVAGKLVFTPGANANGAAYGSLRFQVQDDGGTANGGVDLSVASNSITINVTSVNDAPMAADNSVTTLEDTPYIFAAADFGFTDSNDSPANSLLAVKIDTLPGAGILTDNGVAVTAGQFVSVADIVAGKLVFTPGANANGSAYGSLRFQVQDDGGTASGGVDLSVASNSITINVTSVNDAPMAADNSVTTLEDTPYIFAAADFGFTDSNDSPANSLLAVKIDTLPGAGILTDNGVAVTAGQFVSVADIVAGKLVFTPGANANGSAYGSLRFQVQDDGGTASGGVDLSVASNSITINVTSVNDAPMAADNSVTTLEDTPYIFAAADFGFTDSNDSPANSLLAVKIDTLPGAGILTDNGVAVTAGQFVSVADIVAGKLVFTPGANANGSAYGSLRFQVQDDGGTANGGVDLSVASNSITINVTSVNDAPMAADNSVTTLEDTPYIFAAADFGFTDSNDSPANSLLAVKIDTLPGAGILTDNGVAVTAGQFVSVSDIVAGKLVFTPGANANGSAYGSLRFQVQDDGGTANGGVDLSVASNSITINVTPVNDPPVATDQTVSLADAQAGNPYSFQLPNGLFFDVDGDALTLSVQNLPDGLSFDAASRTISGVPTSRGVGTDTIILTATDPSNTSAQRNLSLVVKPSITTPIISNPNTPDNDTGQGNGGPGNGGAGDAGGTQPGTGSGAGTDTGTTIDFSDTNTYTSHEPGYIHLDTSSTGGGELFVLPGHVSHQGAFHADPSGHMVFTLPDGTFSSNDPGLSANALMADGKPLPDWLAFDAANGTFTLIGPIPPGAHDITVEVVGHTKDGQSIIIKFHLSLPRHHAALTPVQRVHLASGQRAIGGIGKAPVSHLIRAASNEARLSQRNGLIADLAVLFASVKKETKEKSSSERKGRA